MQLQKFDYSKHIKVEMRHKDPKVTYFNQEEEDWNKPRLGETNHFKSLLDS